MPVCAQCQSELPSQSRFCLSCGAAVAAPVAASISVVPTLCANCGAPVLAGARFCGSCGAAQGERAAAPPPQDAGGGYQAPFSGAAGGPVTFGTPAPPAGAPSNMASSKASSRASSEASPAALAARAAAQREEAEERIATKKRKLRKLLFSVPISLAIWGGLFFFFFNSKGCSSVEGSFTASGKPLGAVDLKPVMCKSGQRRGFYGVFILPDKPNKGGLKIVMDPVRGPVVQVELPGSCKPPDLEQCTVITLDKSDCKTYSASIRRTNTSVNRVRLLDGRLSLDCTFKAGGKAQADLKLSSCD